MSRPRADKTCPTCKRTFWPKWSHRQTYCGRGCVRRPGRPRDERLWAAVFRYRSRGMKLADIAGALERRVSQIGKIVNRLELEGRL